MKIAFVLTDHLPDDERVWYQQAEALKYCKHNVFIISSKTDICNLQNVICFNDFDLTKKKVIQKINTILVEIAPEIIICDNPLSIISTKKYKNSTKKKTTVIYDITEWYPSKKNLQNINVLKKIFKFFVLIFLSFYSACVVDKFIFGEYHKSKIFKILFPFKKYIFLPYFATVELIKQYPINDISKKCELFYSGNLTEEKGFHHVLDLALKCAQKMPNTKFLLKIVSNQNFDFDILNKTENIEFHLIKQLPFLDFCKEIGKSDIFLDLRKIDFENNRCLPIKIFYYLTTGRPVIYSELKAIKKFFTKTELNYLGELVKPQKTDAIVTLIEKYINNPDYYKKHCDFSYNITQNKYNWENIQKHFINFVENND
jgi:glycosyltransferase involved in cell wall biosynthesis